MNVHTARVAWTHKVPIAFFVGGSVLLVTYLIDLLIVPVPTIFQPPVGLVVGILYLLLGGAYEWTIQKQKETEEWFEKQKKALNELNELEGSDRAN